MKNTALLLLVTFLIQCSQEFQVGSCRLCKESCGDWTYGGTFRTNKDYGVIRSQDVYEKGCLKVQPGQEQIKEIDIKLCCKDLEIGEEENNENQKIVVDKQHGKIVEYDFEGEKGRLKAAKCKICQKQCGQNQVIRAYFHLDRVGPFKINKTKPEQQAVKEMAENAGSFVSVYGFDEKCQNEIKDTSKMHLKPYKYDNEDGPLEYIYDPEIIMCCDAINNENSEEVDELFSKLNPKKDDDNSNQNINSEESKKPESKDKPQHKSICSFCRKCDPKIHDVLLASLKIDQIPGTVVLPQNCAEGDLQVKGYDQKYEIKASVQLCCLQNTQIYDQISDSVLSVQ